MKLKNSILLSSLLVALATTGCISNNAGGSNQTNKSSPRVKETRQQYDAEIQAGEVIASTDIDSNTSLGLMPDGRLKECSFAGEDAGCRTIATLKIQYDKEHPLANSDIISKLDESGMFHVITGTMPLAVSVDEQINSLEQANSIIRAYRCNYKSYKKGNPICITAPTESSDYSGQPLVMGQVFNYEDSKQLNPYIDKILTNHVLKTKAINSYVESTILSSNLPSKEMWDRLFTYFEIIMYTTLVYDLAEISSGAAARTLKLIKKQMPLDLEKAQQSFLRKVGGYNGYNDLRNAVSTAQRLLDSSSTEYKELSKINDIIDVIRRGSPSRGVSGEIGVMSDILNSLKDDVDWELLAKFKNVLTEKNKLFKNLADYILVGKSLAGGKLPFSFKLYFSGAFKGTFLNKSSLRIYTDTLAIGAIKLTEPALYFSAPYCKEECSFANFETESKLVLKTSINDAEVHTGGIWKYAIKRVMSKPPLSREYTYELPYYVFTDAKDCKVVNGIYPNAIYAKDPDKNVLGLMVAADGEVCNMDKLKESDIIKISFKF